jgi:hypothetical protein
MSWVHQLFNRTPTKKLLGAVPAGGAGGTGESPVGGFITKESFVTFSGATGVISLIWGFANHVVKPSASVKEYIGIGICAVVGLLIYIINITDPNTPPSKRDMLIGFFIALVNTIVLYMASFGLTTTTGN